MSMMQTTSVRLTALLVAGACVSAACGGGGGDDPPTTDDASTTVATNGGTTTTSSSVPDTAPGTTTTSDPTTSTTASSIVVTTTTVTTDTTEAETTTTISCTPVLQRGCETAAVQDLQTLLVEAGIGTITVDGIFGPNTEATLRAFEEGCEVCAVDGRIEIDGPEWIALEATEPVVENEFEAAFSSFIGGGLQDSCQDFAFDQFDSPTIGFGDDLLTPDDPARLVLGYDYDICFVGLDPDEQFEITVEAPSGTRSYSAESVFPEEGALRALFVDDGRAQILLDSSLASARDRLDDPSMPGEYRITATQGDTVATRTVEIVTGEQPVGERRMIPIDERAWSSAQSGDTLRMILIGFPADAEVPLAVYRLGAIADGVNQADFELQTPIESAAVGGQGWGYHDLVLPEVDVDGDNGICIATIAALAELSCRPWDPVINVDF